MKIEFYDIQENLQTKEFDKSKFEFVVNSIKQIVNNDKVLYNKIWIYDDLDNLFAIIRTDNFKIDYIKNLQFTDPNKFSAYKGLPKVYCKLAELVWGQEYYRWYNPKEKINKKILDLFPKVYDAKTIKYIIENEDDEDYYDWLNEDQMEVTDWVVDDLNIDEKYLGKFMLISCVFDNLIGINFKPLDKELVVYRNFNYTQENGKNPKFTGWVSTSSESDYESEFYDDLVERFVLPKGFPACIFKNYGDYSEVLVRNDDLCKL